jgi:hypothetical protein
VWTCQKKKVKELNLFLKKKFKYQKREGSLGVSKYLKHDLRKKKSGLYQEILNQFWNTIPHVLVFQKKFKN